MNLGNAQETVYVPYLEIKAAVQQRTTSISLGSPVGSDNLKGNQLRPRRKWLSELMLRDHRVKHATGEANKPH